MIWRTVLHYTSLWLVLSLVSGELTNEQKNQILDLHNKYRSSVNPQAANMKRMLWDESLSTVAASYATNCTWEHNPKIFGILGENLFMTLGPLNVDQPIGLWYNEYVNYNLYYNSCVEGKLCGHYTQMVWANTSFIGCGAHYCNDVSKFDAKNATILVCNYYPPGNIMGQSPYQEGPPCTKCPNGTLGCTNNYCDLGTSITTGLSPASIATLLNTGNLVNSMNAANAAGFMKPSAVPLLLTALAALYIRMT
ncbi:peptidase inhibitor 16 [Hemibagrus wyckioides]|nr:peptidase inhibitor 16 [Hemibagrus wyckioides]